MEEESVSVGEREEVCGYLGGGCRDDYLLTLTLCNMRVSLAAKQRGLHVYISSSREGDLGANYCNFYCYSG